MRAYTPQATATDRTPKHAYTSLNATTAKEEVNPDENPARPAVAGNVAQHQNQLNNLHPKKCVDNSVVPTDTPKPLQT